MSFNVSGSGDCDRNCFAQEWGHCSVYLTVILIPLQRGHCGPTSHWVRHAWIYLKPITPRVDEAFIDLSPPAGGAASRLHTTHGTPSVGETQLASSVNAASPREG